MPFLVTPDGKFLVTADGKFMVGTDCSCCGEGEPCSVCDSGTSWPSTVPIAFADVTGTMDWLTLTHHEPAQHPWDGSPLSLTLFDAGDIELTNHAPCFFEDDDLEGSTTGSGVTMYIDVGLARGDTPATWGGNVGDPLSANDDDIILIVVINERRPGDTVLIHRWLKIVATETDTNGLPDCQGLLPVSVGPADIFDVSVAGTISFEDFADLRTATITIG